MIFLLFTLQINKINNTAQEFAEGNILLLIIFYIFIKKWIFLR